MAKRKFAEGGGIGSYLKQKIGKAKTKHGVGLAFPMASMDKYVGNRHEGRMRVKRMAGGGQANREGAQVREAADNATEKVIRKYRGATPGDGIPIFSTEDKNGVSTQIDHLPRRRGSLTDYGSKYASGGLVGSRGDGIAQRGKTRARGCK